MKMIHPKQIQLIHIAKAQLGLSREEYEAAIAGQTKGKKDSSKDLTYFEAAGLIDYFVKQGFEIQSNYIRTSGAAKRRRWQPANDRKRAAQTPANVVRMASRDQLDLIDALVRQIPWRVEDGFQRWLTRYMKIEQIRTAAQASRTIEGLKGMLRNQPEGKTFGGILNYGESESK
jgi:hypothetical protein